MPTLTKNTITMKRIIFALLTLFVFCFAKCEKDKPDSNGLPPVTQEGKNTLGFLLNGKPWTPKGFNGTANLSIDFDPGIENGVFGISAYRIISNDIREYFGIGIKDSLNFYKAPFTLALTNTSLYRFYYSNNNCTFFSTDSNTHVSGVLSITKVDRINRIISGTFNATLSKSGCESIEISNGRFDMKF